jgi:autotransporter translocation and assembly factor TamB
VQPGGGLAHLDGVLHGEIDVAGTLARPRVDGWLRLRKLEAQVPRFLRPLHSGQVDVQIERSQARVVARVSSQPGRAEVTGRVNFQRPEATRFSVRARGRNLPVLAGSQLVSINGYVTASGRLRDRLWIIDTRIERGLVVRLPDGRQGELHDTRPLDDVAFVDAAGLAARRAREEVVETAIGIRMTVKTERRVTIRGDIIYTEAEVDLSITRIAGVTAVTGTINATRGWVEIATRRYEIARAVVVLEGQIPPDPHLDVRVTHRFPSAVVHIDVVGPLSDPRVSFASDTGRLDQAQLLALVLGGEGGGAGEARGVGATATGAAASLLAGQITGAIRQSGLPIDALRVGTEAGAEAEVTVTVGKWISDRLFVAYRFRFDADVSENSNEGVFQHHFASDWMWEGVAGDRGTASMDILWVVPF